MKQQYLSKCYVFSRSVDSAMTLPVCELQMQSHSVHATKLFCRLRTLIAAHAPRSDTLTRVHKILTCIAPTQARIQNHRAQSAMCQLMRFRHNVEEHLPWNAHLAIIIAKSVRAHEVYEARRLESLVIWRRQPNIAQNIR